MEENPKSLLDMLPHEEKRAESNPKGNRRHIKVFDS
jgi:hypothetical protein